MFDKSFMVFVAVGIGFYYLITTYVGEIQNEDTSYQSSEYGKEHQFDQYHTVDSIGQDILDVTLADPATQIKAWDASAIKAEYLEIFPDFDTMKGFVKNRVRGEELVNKLLKKTSEVEDKFFSGSMSAEQAKRALNQL
jgi:hypothetical protein